MHVVIRVAIPIIILLDGEHPPVTGYAREPGRYAAEENRARGTAAVVTVTAKTPDDAWYTYVLP